MSASGAVDSDFTSTGLLSSTVISSTELEEVASVSKSFSLPEVFLIWSVPASLFIFLFIPSVDSWVSTKGYWSFSSPLSRSAIRALLPVLSLR